MSPKLLQDLAEDELSAVAERLVRDGEAFWFAILCRATRTAVGQACDRLKLAMVSRAGTAFVSLARLRLATSLPKLREVVHANMEAEGLAARPHSMDRAYVWSPGGERALAVAASADVLDYAWSGWRLALEPFNPGCFVVQAAAAGRVDLLTEMAKSVDDQGIGDHMCHRVMRTRLLAAGGLRDNHGGRELFGPESGVPKKRHTFVQTMHPTQERRVVQALSWVERAIFCAAFKHGDHAAIKWYYAYMEEATATWSGGDLIDTWRTALARPRNDHEPVYVPTADEGLDDLLPLQGLARAAAHGADSFASLTFLVTWMWPRFGSRSPHGPDRERATKIIACAVICSILENVKDQCAETWQWLQGALPQGAYPSLMMLARDVDLHVAPLMLRLWEVRNARVYAWMQARVGPGGWLHELAERNLRASSLASAGSILEREEVSSRLRLAHVNLKAVLKRRQEAVKFNADVGRDEDFGWENERALVVAALTDAFCWAWDRPGLYEYQPSMVGAHRQPYDESSPASPEWRRQFERDTGVHVDQLRKQDVAALVEVLCACGSRSGRPMDVHTASYLDQTCLRKLMEFGSGCTHAMQQRLRRSGWLAGGRPTPRDVVARLG